MLQIRHILFPVDFSTRCSATAGAVQALAQRTGALVTLFHAVRSPLDWIDPPYPQSFNEKLAAEAEPYTGVSERLRAERMETLRDFRPELWNPSHTRYIVENGDAASALLACIESLEPDIVMIPTHGHRAFHRFLAGSVTTRLLHDASCPVWTDAHVEEFRPGIRDTCDHVFCAVDLADMAHDKALVMWALDYAKLWGVSRIRLVHAVPGAIRIPGQPDEPFALTLMNWAKEGMATLQRLSGLDNATTIAVEADKPESLLAQLVEEPKSSVVIIGRGGSRGVLGRLGSQAYSIIRGSPCPVISI